MSFCRRLIAIAARLILLLTVLLAAGCSSLPGSEDLPSATPAPPSVSPELSPTGTVPSTTPQVSITPDPQASATPAPFDVTTVKDGGFNPFSVWDADGTLLTPAPVDTGKIIYANNFEREEGNRLAPGNSGNEAEIYATDVWAYNGLFSNKVTRRKQDYHGLSGLGFHLSEINGLSYDSLVGRTLKIQCRIYYEDEGFGSASELNFALFDGYHTEFVSDYVYNPRDGQIKLDSNGSPLRETKERFVLCDSYPVSSGRWTLCTFYVKVKDVDVEEPEDPDNPDGDPSENDPDNPDDTDTDNDGDADDDDDDNDSGQDGNTDTDTDTDNDSDNNADPDSGADNDSDNNTGNDGDGDNDGDPDSGTDDPDDPDEPEEPKISARQQFINEHYLLLGTINESPNSIGLFCSYYIDDLVITVVPDEEAPDRTRNRLFPDQPADESILPPVEWIPTPEPTQAPEDDSEGNTDNTDNND